MSKKILIALAIVLVLSLASGAWVSASAEGPELPFKAYYPVAAVYSPGPSGCTNQSFTPGGDGLASHMGLSLFYGEAQSCAGKQIGNGNLIAANGDTLIVHTESTSIVMDGAGHIIGDGWYVITGGTGRFANVTGEGTFHVFVYLSGAKPNDLWFVGHLHNP